VVDLCPIDWGACDRDRSAHGVHASGWWQASPTERGEGISAPPHGASAARSFRELLLGVPLISLHFTGIAAPWRHAALRNGPIKKSY